MEDINMDEGLTMDELYDLLSHHYKFLDTYNNATFLVSNHNIGHIEENTFNKKYFFKIFNEFTQFKNGEGKGLILLSKRLSEDYRKIKKRQQAIESFIENINENNYESKFKFRLDQINHYRASIIDVLGATSELIFNYKVENLENLSTRDKLKQIDKIVFGIKKNEKLNNTNCDMEQVSKEKHLDVLRFLKKSIEEVSTLNESKIREHSINEDELARVTSKLNGNKKANHKIWVIPLVIMLLSVFVCTPIRENFFHNPTTSNIELSEANDLLKFFQQFTDEGKWSMKFDYYGIHQANSNAFFNCYERIFNATPQYLPVEIGAILKPESHKFYGEVESIQDWVDFKPPFILTKKYEESISRLKEFSISPMLNVEIISEINRIIEKLDYRIGHLSYIENFGISDCWKIDHSFQDQIKNVASRFMSIKSIHVLI